MSHCPIPMMTIFLYWDSFTIHFKTVKGLIADLKFSFRERDRSRLFFLKLTPKQAFESVKIELNFLYEILFTKTQVLRGFVGFTPSRFVSSVLRFVAFLLFHLMDPKHKFLHHKIDVEITYALLLGTIIHDVIAFFVIGTSDWTAVTKINIEDKDGDTNLCILMTRIHLAPLCSICLGIGLTVKTILFKWIPIMERRWSRCIYQYNFIFYCLHPRSRKWDKLIGNLGLANILDGMKYVKTKRFTEALRDFIFDELKLKSTEAIAIETALEICSAKGDWVLTREGGCENLLPYTLHADYDKILILWHIATELCYITEEGNSENEQEISKAGTAQIRFRDTCATAKRFFQDRGVLEKEKEYSCFGHKPDMIQACKSILDVHMVVNPSIVKGDTSKTVFFEACILAKELKNLDKGVIVQSTTAVASLSISSNGIRNKNRLLISEATDVWANLKTLGLSYKGDDDEVISKIAHLEEIDEERFQTLKAEGGKGDLLGLLGSSFQE
ncbi:hypothetical protein Vadar_030106 [Vaccinium darrowii]|uniref:Uncharacterized protein n=1 Tax=Vaccinium darrowii TaxID=229202 RepID=A0ACB7YZV3_9ERIC|nr:hypothetical protein Vadar_030106 [Vaccinium darrowii]